MQDLYVIRLHGVMAERWITFWKDAFGSLKKEKKKKEASLHRCTSYDCSTKCMRGKGRGS